MLSRRNANLSSVPASGDAPPLAPVAASPALGIFSGQPMRNYPVLPPIFQLPDRSVSDDDDWYQRW
jgi:hypothetical protein